MTAKTIEYVLILTVGAWLTITVVGPLADAISGAFTKASQTIAGTVRP